MGMHFIEVHSFKQDAYRKCNICNLEFAEERKYNSHMRKHDESFQCELCKRKITGRLWFERHQKECEGGERGPSDQSRRRQRGAGNLWEGVRRALGGGYEHIYQGHSDCCSRLDPG